MSRIAETCRCGASITLEGQYIEIMRPTLETWRTGHRCDGGTAGVKAIVVGGGGGGGSAPNTVSGGASGSHARPLGQPGGGGNQFWTGL